MIMRSELEYRVACHEYDRFVELLFDLPDSHRSFGDCYFGKVEAVLPGIQAAFVDIGAEKSAFLHASDLIEAEEDEDPEDREPEDVDEGNGDGNGNGSGNGGGRGEGKGGAQAVANRRGQPRPSRRRPAPNIADELKRGQTKLVQVIKEAIGTKQPRLTAKVPLAPRFLHHLPSAPN